MMSSKFKNVMLVLWEGLSTTIFVVLSIIIIIPVGIVCTLFYLVGMLLHDDDKSQSRRP